MASKKQGRKVETKKAEPRKETPNAESKSDVVAADRERVLGMLRSAGLRVEKKTSWTKATGGRKGTAVYVANKGPQVHLSGFTVKGHLVEQVSESEAKRRHIGKVRGIFHLDRNDSAAIAAAMRAAIAEVK